MLNTAHSWPHILKNLTVLQTLTQVLAFQHHIGWWHFLLRPGKMIYVSVLKRLECVLCSNNSHQTGLDDISTTKTSDDTALYLAMMICGALMTHFAPVPSEYLPRDSKYLLHRPLFLAGILTIINVIYLIGYGSMIHQYKNRDWWISVYQLLGVVAIEQGSR